MEQHPIPQQIASYQFKLVGDMTLKQFSQLAGGVLISLLLYSTPIHPFIKWPLIVVSFLFGVALAFLPIEDRPLSTWILIFFRSIYSPTYFVWNKTKKPPEYFMPEESTAKPASIRIAEKKEDVQELLEPVIKQTEVTDKLEEKEKKFLMKLTQSFIAPNTTVVISTTPVHTYTQQPAQPTYAVTETTPKPEAVLPTVPLTSLQPVVQTAPKTETKIPPTGTVGSQSLSGYQIPQTKGATQSGPVSNTSVVSPMSYPKMNVQNNATSQFSANVIPPPPATRENIVVGQILDTSGQTIEGAILEIKDPDGRPVRALRSNKLGHFMIVTPLIAGDYIIQTEKDGFEFEPYKLKAENKIIPAIAIWAKKGNVTLPVQKVAVKNDRPQNEQEFMKDFQL